MLNNLLRWLRGGIKETQFEFECLKLCLEHLPDKLRPVALKQISEYNLVQREIDQRALNYYNISVFLNVVNPSELLPISSDDCILIKLVVETENQDKINVALHATGYRIFCICFNKSVAHLANFSKLNVCSVTNSWETVI